MLRYRIEIDRGLCSNDGLCCEQAPGTFERDNQLEVVVVNPEGDPPEDILAAARNCPLDAITLHDALTGEKIWPR